MEESLSEMPLSWISEYAFCRRRFYLRYVECMNLRSASMIEGKYEHRVVDDRHITKRGSHIIVSKLYVCSEKYSLYGLCDNVEFDEKPKEGSFIPFLNGLYTIIPVEFKHGKKRNEIEYEKQLCAQVLCLEEMYDAHIEQGIIYYVDSKDRMQIEITDELRQGTLDTIQSIRRDLFELSIGKRADLIFPIKYQKRCEKCALYDVCSPKKLAVSAYMKKLWAMGNVNDNSR
jgi:CRISPR-associated exonuclease Cas4